MRKVVVILLALVFVVGVSSIGYSRGGYKKSHGDKKFDEKVMMKLHLAMMNKDELELSDNQISKIKSLKVNTKKDLIKKNADIEILAVDIMSGLWAEKIDTRSINQLIDKKYNIKKEKAKALIAVCADLQKILSKNQKESLKEIMKAKFKDKKDYHKGKKECNKK